MLRKPEVPAILGMKVAQEEAAPLEERRSKLQQLLDAQLEDYEAIYHKALQILQLT